jgi:hypothetical protein
MQFGVKHRRGTHVEVTTRRKKYILHYFQTFISFHFLIYLMLCFHITSGIIYLTFALLSYNKK